MNFWSKNKGNIILFILSIIIFWLSDKYGIIEWSKLTVPNSHYNLITINAIFAGFLFTGLGIMVSFSTVKRIKRLNQYGFLDKYYNAIYFAIFFHIISIISSLLLISDIKYKVVIASEKIFLFLGIIFFVKSIFNLIKIINKVRFTRHD